MYKNCIELKKIALELLKKYKHEAEGTIYEYSIDIEQDQKKLHAECEEYKRQIDSLSE